MDQSKRLSSVLARNRKFTRNRTRNLNRNQKMGRVKVLLRPIKITIKDYFRQSQISLTPAMRGRLGPEDQVSQD